MKMSTELFGRLSARAIEIDPDFPVYAGNRWISRESDDDAELMSNARAVSLVLNMGRSAIQICYREQILYGFVGFDVENISEGLTPVDTTPGLFAIGIIEGDIQPIATPSQIRDIVEDQSHLIDGYSGHQLSQILPLFPPIIFYTSNSNYDFLKDIERAVGSVLVRNPRPLPLALASSTAQHLIELFEAGPSTVPFRLPLQGIVSFNWQALFLELYRAIEQLYSVPKLRVLIEDLNYIHSVRELARLIETSLSWRPKEEEALTNLLAGLEPSLCGQVVRALKRTQDQEPKHTPENAARKIYGLRNDCVHFRPATEQVSFSAGQWNDIISIMTVCVKELYDIYGDVFQLPNPIKTQPLQAQL
ncbi:hypothetical protein ELH50_01205 [Rhizobium ruizarguesonis]|uniref:hypothetical protein n=1 Tax=Rhizobium TaxID=379 RepID=UPI0010308274|nr:MULTISPECIES: hypothetical protein [Rhizobium]TAU81956.1 hypothetical protein ELI40_00930 [Rhizobium leguminosarum]TBB09816.1 hypothetical protein ELH50_01205 [Rhizobium ruizarguesonis]